ncbi:N-acetylglucosamine-6-phosphate deacetylase [Mariniphaga sediminis]|jgi:N-acetylglucosamine-6-phosphate deacetylase|uniref:N-acetylglucosamine-6-phosphate deacetylase n=2 Tax=Mariniphaga sediminis TaxID=1628158 RepID=A0A399D4A8_9BACT|nr:N-acetylglucosamine-6-phosphate deacetylase [Mariniphaga sediminis]RIH66306.1 N-acetylglucosamine-6-phosphate deacetylase [Mariniphaga sediminis]
MNYKKITSFIIRSFSVFALFLFGMSEMSAQQIIEGIHYHTGQPVQVKINNGVIEDITVIDKVVGENPVFIAPGFFDNQVNGFAGVSFVFGDSDLTPEGIEKATHALWKKGVTTYLPTLTTNNTELLIKNLSILSKAVDAENMMGSIPGFHLEGPYINPEDGYRGAHPKRFVKLPDWDEFMRFQKAAGGHIMQVTLAPEMEGALDFITNCSKKGVVVALGHHNADAATVSAAIDRGAKIATHLGNGAANMINRHRNPFWSQLADDRLSVSIICDSFHLLPEEIQVFYKVKGVEKTVITSDVTHYAALEPGKYNTSTGETIELTEDGLLHYPAQKVLYGSASPITKGVGYIMQVTGCSLADAVQMASTNPAKLYNLNDRGVLEPGKRADLVLFTLDDFKVNIQQTWVQGKLVYKQ